MTLATHHNPVFHMLGIFVMALVLLNIISATAAYAQPAPVDAHFASLRVGDTEAAVIHVMQASPKEVHRSSIAGVEKSRFVFESGRTRHMVTFIAGRLVAKSVETNPAVIRV